MRRGEVWRVSGLAGERTMLVIGNDAIVELYAGVQCVEIATSATARETLVTVHVNHPVVGTALVASTGPVLKKRFQEHLGTVDEETMERIVVALRAVYDMP